MIMSYKRHFTHSPPLLLYIVIFILTTIIINNNIFPVNSSKKNDGLLKPNGPKQFMAAKSTEPVSGDKWVPTNLKPLDDEPLPSGKRVGTVVLEVSKNTKPKHQYRVIEGTQDADKGVAWGFYNDVTNDIGWSVLQIDTSKTYLDEEQMYAAGLLEGFLTATRIRQLFINDKALRDQDQLKNLYSYFEVQDDFIRIKYKEAMKTTPKSEDEHDSHAYWRQVGLELAQLDGLLDGYNNGVSSEHKLRLGDMWLLNMDGDVIDLERAFSTGQLSVQQVSNEAETRQSNVGGLGDLTGQMRFKEIVSIILNKNKKMNNNDNDNNNNNNNKNSESKKKLLPTIVPGPRAMKYNSNFNKKDPLAMKKRYSEKKWDILQRHSRCSALIKVLPDFSDIYVGHTTWADYSELLRIWKTYNFQLKDPAVVAKKISFSSYAGMISSTDDWYITDAGLLILETTTNVEDENALSQINPKGSVVSWIRTMVANRLAKIGKDWADIYAQQNSGTYNCEWMILDYNKFSAGSKPKAGFFTMIEQVPGKIHQEDMTETLLNRGDKKCPDTNGDSEMLRKCKEKHMYWPSINRPYFKDIRDAAGYPLDAASTPQNEFFSFEDNPRGRLLQRDQKFVGSVDDMMVLMQYNDPADPMQGKAGHAISARFDVPDAETGTTQRKPTGGIESKVTNAKMVRELASVAQLGPSHDAKLPKWRDPGQSKPGPMKPFRWDADDSFMKIPHYGIPMELGFPWQMMGPSYKDSFPQSKETVHNEIEKHETDLPSSK